MADALVEREEQYIESALEMAGLDPADSDAEVSDAFADESDPRTPGGPENAATVAESPGWRSPSVCGSHVRALLPLMKEFDAREVRTANLARDLAFRRRRHVDVMPTAAAGGAAGAG